MPVEDIRLRIDFRTHPKTRRLQRVLGDAGVRCLIWLWLGAAARRASGELYGWDAEEIELEADWHGPPHGLVDVLVQQGWLEKRDDGLFVLHDWKSEQPFVTGAPGRSQRAADAARIRWDRVRNAQGIPKASTDVDSAPDARRIPDALRNDAPTLPVPTQTVPIGGGEERLVGGVVVPIDSLPAVPKRVRQEGDLALVAAAHEASGLFKTDLANFPQMLREVEHWLSIRTPGHIAKCYSAIVREMAKPDHDITSARHAIGSLVLNVGEGEEVEWKRRTAGDGTAPWKKPRESAAARLRRQSAEQAAAEGKG